MSDASAISELERAEHLAYADSKGVKRVSLFNDGAQINAATEEKQDSIVSAIQNITIPAPEGGATEVNQETLISLIGTLQELCQRLAPLAGTLIDILKKEDFNGDPYTMQALKEDPADVSWRLIKGLVVPIPLGSAKKNLEKYDASTALAISIVDGLGFGSNTYGFTNNWNKDIKAELQQFKDKVGKEEFDKANDVYATAVNEKILKLRKDNRFESMSDEEKTKVLNKVKDVEKEKIFKQYKFTYKKGKSEANKDKETEALKKEYSR